MGVRLHRGGRTRSWLGAQLGGDIALGDRAWRRGLHLAGLLVLAVFVLPAKTFGPVPVRVVLVLALAAVLCMEAARLLGHLSLPTIRPHEEGRVASYAYYAVALTVAVLAFPEVVAVVAVAGAAVVDPLLGELRLRGIARPTAALLGTVVYAAVGVLILLRLSTVPVGIATIVALGVGALAVSVEGPGSWLPVDDDLATVLLPGASLALLAWLGPGGWGW